MQRVAAGAAVLGGLVWISTVVILALRPLGSSGAARSSLDLHPLTLVALFLMASSATAFARALASSRLAWTGAATSWVAVALFTVNVGVVLATGDDAPVWPTHYSAFFFMALGVALLGIAALRRGALPAIASILMIVPPLVMPIGNMQDHRVLLWLPLGLASLTLGAVLVKRS